MLLRSSSGRVGAWCACLGAFALGCNAHGRTGAHVGAAMVDGNVSATATVGASATVAVSGDATVGAEVEFARRVGIRFCQGRFEYEGTIYFDYNKDTLKNDPNTTSTMARWHEYLMHNPKLRVLVVGRTDSRGSPDLNKSLSRRRAKTIVRELKAMGVPEGQFAEPEGAGEDGAKEFEGDACFDKEPANCEDKDTPVGGRCECREVWEKSRRAEFRPSKDTDTVAEDCVQPAAPSEKPAPPPPEPPPPPEKEVENCRENLIGFHIDGGGPHQYAGAALAWQPKCWLELSAGVGYKQGSVTGEVTNVDTGTRESGSFKALTFPLRARFWVLKRHSPIFDLGVGPTIMKVSVTSNAQADINPSPGYTSGFVFAGVGYGYRSDGPFRLGVLGGVAVMPRGISRFTDLSAPQPYPELSLGFLW